MTDIVSVVGARPQFIKAATVSRALLEAGLRERIVHTGQHYDDNMSAVFFNELEIPAPSANLGVGSGTHAAQTGEIMKQLESILMARPSPDCVLVYGDTNSTIAAAITARKLLIPVAHVEAGLRSFNRRMPEEINRIVTDRLSDLLFTPTETAVRHLADEGITDGVHLTGDVMYDATVHYADRIASTDVDAPASTFYLATVHRAENTDDPARFAGIMEGLGRLGDPVVLLVHPRIRERIQGRTLPDNLILRPPQSYLTSLALVKQARRVLTDSGGLQKESLWMGTPCITLRDETEWVETLLGNWNILAGANPLAIEEAVTLDPVGAIPLFGRLEGLSASNRIASILRDS